MSIGPTTGKDSSVALRRFGSCGLLGLPTMTIGMADGSRGWMVTFRSLSSYSDAETVTSYTYLPCMNASLYWLSTCPHEVDHTHART